jgi:hypothetical protein
MKLIIPIIAALLLAGIAAADIDTNVNHAITYKFPDMQNDLVGLDVNTLGAIDFTYNDSAYFPSTDVVYQFIANEQYYSSLMPRGAGIGTGAENVTTLCFRVKNNAPTSTNLIVGHILSSGSDRWWPFKFTFEAGNITFWERTNAAWESVTGHQLTGWNRICGVQNGTHLWLYENGNLAIDAELTAGIRQAGNPSIDDWRWTTGDSSSATQNFSLQDFVGYTRILTPQEIIDGQLVYFTSTSTPHWTAIPAPNITWEALEPISGDKYPDGQLFYYSVDQTSDCSLYANGSLYSTAIGVNGLNSLFYNITAPFTATEDFYMNCTSPFGSGISSTKSVSFDTENPLVCPENNCQPVDGSNFDMANSQIVPKYFECKNTHLEYMNVTWRNSTATLAFDQYLSGGLEANFSGMQNMSGYPFGSYYYDVVCYENPKVASTTLSFTTSCTESWTCSDWTPECNGFDETTQTRSCADANNCGTNISQPSNSQVCATPNAGGLPLERRFYISNPKTQMFSLFQEVGRGTYSLFSNLTHSLPGFLLIMGLVGSVAFIIITVMGKVIKGDFKQ